MLTEPVVLPLPKQPLETNGTILLVEQNANLALQIADRGYVLEAGQMILSALPAISWWMSG